jgi:hypothetical protein
MRSPRGMVRYSAPSIPSQTNGQSTRGLTAPRTRPTSRSRPCEAWSVHIMLPYDCSLMELDHTEAIDDQSLNHCSFSDYNDNAFVTFEAPPPPACKKAAEKVERNNRLARVGKRPLLPPLTMARPWHTPSLLQPWPKALASPWLSFQKGIDGTHQWMVLP